MSYDTLEFDVRRTIFLSLCIKAWGWPKDRKVIKKDNRPPIEIYLFISVKLVRFVTIGLSQNTNAITSKSINHEILFASGHDIAGSSLGHAMYYV